MENKKEINLTEQQFKEMKERHEITGLEIGAHNKLMNYFDKVDVFLYVNLRKVKHDAASFNFIMNRVMSFVDTVSECFGISKDSFLEYLRKFEW